MTPRLVCGAAAPVLGEEAGGAEPRSWGCSVWLPAVGCRLARPLGLQNRSALASAEARGSGARSASLLSVMRLQGACHRRLSRWFPRVFCPTLVFITLHKISHPSGGMQRSGWCSEEDAAGRGLLLSVLTLLDLWSAQVPLTGWRWSCSSET